MNTFTLHGEPTSNQPLQLTADRRVISLKCYERAFDAMKARFHSGS
jgi:hypothetical protein